MVAAWEMILQDDASLLAECEVRAHRASGPGGQRRNKVATAIRLVHGPTGVSAQGEDSRHQAENMRAAVQRLRRNLACRHRTVLEATSLTIPAVVAECLHARKASGGGPMQLSVGRKDHRFWAVAAFVLDLLQAYEGRLSDAAARLGVSTANLAEILTCDKHLLTAANEIRKRFDHKPLR